MPQSHDVSPEVLAQLMDESIGTVDLNDEVLVDQSNQRATANTCYRTCFHCG